MRKITIVFIAIFLSFMVLNSISKNVMAYCDGDKDCQNMFGGKSYCDTETHSCEDGNDPVPTAIPAPALVKCTCGTTAFSACGAFAGKTNVKHRLCNLATTGTIKCIKQGVGTAAKYYQILACTGPTVTPGGPTVTPKATPTVNPLCVCNAANTCSTQCTFHKQAGITTYNTPIKCGLAATLFASAPVATNKTDWCRRPNKTKGDANGDDKVTIIDYLYYVSAKFGGKVPPTVNVDFNGDGQINLEDRAVIIKTL